MTDYIHYKRRDGYSKRTPLDVVATEYRRVPERVGYPTGVPLHGEVPTLASADEVTYISRYFRLVKSASVTDHRTHTTRNEYWYEEV